MKPLTRESYARRIERAVDLLARRLADGHPESLPSNEELAEAAAMSPFHFLRVYRLMTGETPARTHQRLRLLRALHHHSRIEGVSHAGGDGGRLLFQPGTGEILEGL